MEYKITFDRPTFDANTLLVLDAWNLNASPPVIVLQGQTYNETEGVKDFQYIVTPTTNGGINTFAFPGLNGTLIWWRLDVETPGLQHGECYARVCVARGSSTTTLQYRYVTLWAGYIETGGGMAFWPNGISEPPGFGNGFTSRATQGNPAAGADWSFSLPSNFIARPIHIQAQLVTSVNAATRVPRLMFSRSGNFLWIEPMGTGSGVTASTTQVYVTAQNHNGVYTGGAGTDLRSWQSNGGPFPILKPSDTVNSVTLNIDAADQWSGIIISFEAWTTP